MLDGRDPPPPPPPVQVRLRSGFIKLQKTGDETFKDITCPYFAFVAADASEWSDKLKRRAGDVPVPEGGLPALSPESLRTATKDTNYLPTGGLTEICYIAVPQDLIDPPAKNAPRYPGVMSLYRGFRTPIGDKEKSLLDPRNLDTVAKIKAACRLVAEGLVHFGVRWRRAFATSWEIEQGIGLGETAAYVGPIWDSTRALDKEWPLFRGLQSLGDPSDDIFPPFVRLEATLAEPSQFGHGRGEMQLVGDVAAEASEVAVSDPDLLLGIDLGKERWLKIDGEWMQFEARDVDYQRRKVRVRRGMRGTTKAAHNSGAWVYIGRPSMLEVRLPVFRDRTIQVGGDRR
jgi:hypothetical protein